MKSITRFDVIKLFFLGILSVIIYSNALNGPFVFDDVHNIQENPGIYLTQFSFNRLYQAAFSGPCPTRPIPKLSFALNYYFHRLRVFGYHLVNVLIHAINTMMLYEIIRQTLLLIGSRKFSANIISWIAFFSSGVWAVHPIQTQAVSYIVQRMTSMAAMFYLLSLLTYIYGRHQQTRIRKIILYVTSAFFGVCALGSKENSATLPFIICLYEWFFFQELKPLNRKKFMLILLGLGCYTILIGWIYLGSDPIAAIESTYHTRDFSLTQRLLTQFRVIIFYISLIIFPHPDRLNPDHDFSISYSLFNPPDTILAAFAISWLVFTSCMMAKKYPLFSFCVLWFLINLVIESSVIGLEIIFEHRLYLPSMLLFLPLVLFAYHFIPTRWIRLEILAVCMVVLSVWTYSRNFMWADDLALWQDCVQKSPYKDRPHVSLGVSLVKRGRFEEAEFHYREALRINPNNYVAHHNLASLVSVESAIAQYSEAIRLNPSYAEAHNNLGVAYATIGEFQKAKRCFINAIRIKNNFKAPYNNLGNLFLGEGKIEEAESMYRLVLSIDPEDPQANNNLGVVFLKKGMIQEAGNQFSKALRLHPDYKDAQNNLRKYEQEIKKIE